MDLVHTELTLAPPATGMDSLAGALAGDVVTLVAADGTPVEVPSEVGEGLRELVSGLARGCSVTVATHGGTLTTGEAASMLGISRPTLVRLLEQGAIPYEQPCRHRRVLLRDVLAYQQSVRRANTASTSVRWEQPGH